MKKCVKLENIMISQSGTYWFHLQAANLRRKQKLLDAGDVFDSLLLDGADGKSENESPRKKGCKTERS